MSLGPLSGRAGVSAELTDRGGTPAIEGRAHIPDLVAGGRAVEPIEASFRMAASSGPDSRWEGTVRSSRVRWDQLAVENITASLAVDARQIALVGATRPGSGRADRGHGDVGMGRVGPGSRRARPGGAGRHHRRTALAARERHGSRDGGRIGRARSRLGERARDSGSAERRRRIAGRRSGPGPVAGPGARGRDVVPRAAASREGSRPTRVRRRAREQLRARKPGARAVAPRARLGRGRPRRGPRVEPRGAVDPARPAGERTRRRPSHPRRPAAPRRAVGEPGADRAALGGAAIRAWSASGWTDPAAA